MYAGIGAVLGAELHHADGVGDIRLHLKLAHLSLVGTGGIFLYGFQAGGHTLSYQN